MEKIRFEEDTVTLLIKVPLESKKFLMTDIIKRQLAHTVLRQTPHIQRAEVLKQKEEAYIQCEGVNFEMVLGIPEADFYRTGSNDIWAVLQTFGVEAARQNIILEILRVLNHYGVKVDPRHFSLVSDFMTFSGAIRSMNRNAIEESPSPLLKMSFETSMKFLSKAALSCELDAGLSPSSSITLGRAPKLGTGTFDLLVL